MKNCPLLLSIAVLGAGSLLPAPARAQDPLITEVAAIDQKAILDEDGDASDWLEIHNPGSAALDLEGWYLTDNPGLPRKWRFPRTILQGGDYLVVFASGKDRRTPGGELHANFRIDGAGEYLALVRPDGLTPAHEYAPALPRQRAGFTYGIGEDREILAIVPAGAPAAVLVPDAPVGSEWTGSSEPFDDSAWIRGATGVGYVVSQPGFAVRVFLSSTGVGALSTAEEVIRNRNLQVKAFAENVHAINFFNTGGAGHYAPDAPFPGTAIGEDADHFVVEATGTITIPSAGAWTFGVSSDDGFGLDIAGNGQSFRIEHPAPRGPGDTVGVFNVSAPGPYEVRLVFYEQGGGSELEFYAAKGSYSSWSSVMKLVGDTAAGGLAVESRPVELSPAAGLKDLIATDVASAMYGKRTSAYVRIPFTIADPRAYASLALRVQYDDGFVAYLNGAEVARRNAPSAPAFDSRATADRPIAQAVAFQDIDISDSLGLLEPGWNILALHGLNDRPDSGEFLVRAELAQITVRSMAQGFFQVATPGAPNAQVFRDFVADTKFDPDRGFYDEPFFVTITSATEGAQIYYTTDGSAPDAQNGILYTGPLPVSRTTTLRARAFKAGHLPTDIDAHTYIFLDDVLVQTGEGFPTSWVSAPADYEVDPNVVQDPRYRDEIRRDLQSLPVMSIVMDLDDLFGPERGIYTHATSEGIAWERPASVEMFYPEGVDATGDDEGFQVNCGIRIHGGVGRIPQVPKHSLRLLFKGAYGPTKLKYSLFGGSATTSFDTLILRAGFNNSWVFNSPGEMQQAEYIRDQWIRDSILSTGRAASHGMFVHLYLNGLYWGLYNLVERPSAPFAAAYYGGDKEEWDVLNAGEVTDGARDAWNQMQALAAAGLATEGQYRAIQEYLDVPNLIDYMLVNFYGGNGDWDGHNWYAGRRRLPGEGYKFFSWDAERTLESVYADRTGIGEPDKPSYLYSRLRANPEFLVLFADHAHRHLFDGGALSPEVAGERFRRRMEEITGGIVGESARWGDSHREPPFTRGVEWAAECNRLLNQYFPQRTGIFLSQLRAAGLYPAIDAPRFSVHGGRIARGFQLVVTVSEGTAYYTLDGSDPRLPGGAVSPAARVAGSSSSMALVGPNAPLRVLVPTNGSLGLAWTAPDFDDAAWTPGVPGVGFERGSGYEALIATDVGAAMYGVNASVYIRIPFEVADPSSAALLELRMEYEDGFVAYLNGRPVASSNAPASPEWNSVATANRGDDQAVVFEKFDIPDGAALLRAGRNVLAIHGMNVSTTSSDLLFIPELRAVDVSSAGIPIERTATVRARAWLGGSWSALNEALFFLDVPLRITEVMYHPRPPEAGGPYEERDFEFVELENVGSDDIDLGGLRLAGAIRYEFPWSIVTLPPGAVIVVARNVWAFRERYPSRPGILLGPYQGALSNSREAIRLEGPAGEPLLEFEYRDSWYSETDGEGYSLIVLDPGAAPETWGDPASWRPSFEIDGSPGVVESGPAPAGGLQIPGNLNQDLSLDIADAVTLLAILFSGGRRLPCGGGSIAEGGNLVLADANGDGAADLADAVYLLDYLFRSGPAPARGVRCIRIEGCPSVCPR